MTAGDYDQTEPASSYKRVGQEMCVTEASQNLASSRVASDSSDLKKADSTGKISQSDVLSKSSLRSQKAASPER